jgi:hypothetical protein
MDGLEKIDVRQNEILWVRLRSLEAENKRLRVELDWMREKFLEAETMLWWDQTATAFSAQQQRSVGSAPSA